MPTHARRRRALTAAASAAFLLTGLAGCADGPAAPDPSGAAAASSSASASASASVSASASASVSASVSAAPSATPAAATSSPVAPATTPAAAPAPPPAPTRLTVGVETRSGKLALVRGGAAQEFTVTLRNGNSAAYRHLLIAFQMESLPGGPDDVPGTGPGFLLERFDQASRTWRPAAFRIANDTKPDSLFTGGTPLAHDALRVERYRLRATAGGPTGSSPVVVSFIDTDADRQVAGRVSLPHNTR
ncbi:hypothetical protein ACLF6K_04720 [Streptomyces xanthophaeus]|uniref:hypothetical protein n=1 Tax=Streptomyces xanthophaeus TaxID=67385 RepID=UPI00398F8F36